MKKYKYRSILREEPKHPPEIRAKWASYMRERRRKIKLGLLVPTPADLRTLTNDPHYYRDYQRRARAIVLKHYGSKCACCGEKQVEFLAIDHINNDGAKHRREVGSRNISTWLIANKFPLGFQILCHNCNYAKSLRGQCPHQSIKLLTK